jgi:hypothetical protein
VRLHARYYEPTSGRFLSADPFGQTVSPSLYDYAGGDPVNFFDPDGRAGTISSNSSTTTAGNNFSQADFNAGWHYSGQYSRATFPDPASAAIAAGKIADNYQHFTSFNTPTMNYAVVAVQGNQASFYLGANGPETPGFLQGYMSNVINDAGATVNLSSQWSNNGQTFVQTAVTVGDHPLVGVREWTVTVIGNDVTYGTFAYEQPRSVLFDLNGLGYSLLGGATDQSNIWNTYLSNISADLNFQNYVVYSHSWSLTTQDNPFILPPPPNVCPQK